MTSFIFRWHFWLEVFCLSSFGQMCEMPKVVVYWEMSCRLNVYLFIFLWILILVDEKHISALCLLIIEHWRGIFVLKNGERNIWWTEMLVTKIRMNNGKWHGMWMFELDGVKRSEMSVARQSGGHVCPESLTKDILVWRHPLSINMNGGKDIKSDGHMLDRPVYTNSVIRLFPYIWAHNNMTVLHIRHT